MQIIEARTKKRVLGVVPYLKDLLLPQEDSVALERKMSRTVETVLKRCRLALSACRTSPIIRILIPWSRNPASVCGIWITTVAWKVLMCLSCRAPKILLRICFICSRPDWPEKLKNMPRAGGRVIGICGGFQMLGQWVRDPLGVEGNLPEAAGLGLLPIITTMAGEKTTTQVEARFLGLEIEKPRSAGL